MGCIMDNYSIFIHTPVNGWHHIYLSLVQFVPPLLYFIFSYVDVPCLWNIEMTMTGTILETKQKVTWSTNNHNTRFEIEF